MTHPYGLSEHAARATATASLLAHDVLSAHAADVDAQARFPRESINALAGAGLMGLCQPAALGGKGEGMRAFAAVTEELAMACGSTAMIYVMHVSAAQAIASSPSMKDRDAILRQVASGHHLTTLAFSERGSRSLFWAPVSRLSPNGNGFHVHAEKSWVTSAANADSYVASSQRPEALSPLESTVFLVRSKSPGVRVSGRFDGLGLRGNDSAPVDLEEVTVGSDDLISLPGEGANTMLQVVLPWFSIGTAAMSNGLCRAAVAITTQHLSGTTFTHSGSQLRDLPNLRARLAEMSVRTEQARALLGHTLAHLEAGLARSTAVRAADAARLAAGGDRCDRSRHEGVRRRGVLEAPGPRARVSRCESGVGDGADRGSSARVLGSSAHRTAALRMNHRESDCAVRAMRQPDGRVAVVARNLSFQAEGQTSLDARASAPSALDYLVSALAADLLGGLGREAARAGVPLHDAELSLSAWLDNPLAALGVAGEGGTPALSSVTGTLYVSSDAEAEQLRSLWARALDRAPVYSTLCRCVSLRIALQTVS